MTPLPLLASAKGGRKDRRRQTVITKLSRRHGEKDMMARADDPDVLVLIALHVCKIAGRTRETVRERPGERLPVQCVPSVRDQEG